MAVKATACLSLFLTLWCVSVSTSTSTSTTSTSTASSTDKASGACVLFPTTDVRDTLEGFLKSGASLVYIHMRFTEEAEPTPGETFHRLEKDLGFFRAASWQRSTSRQGRSLLMLSDHYDVLSLSLLSIRVEHLDVTLSSSPARCLVNMTSQEVYEALRALLLNDFKLNGDQPGSGSLTSEEHICYQKIRHDEDNMAKFVYVCCRAEDELRPTTSEAGQGRVEVMCSDVERDPWINLLLVAVLLIKVLVVLFSPNLLPDTVYRLKYATLCYVLHLPHHDRVTVRMLKTKTPWIYGHDDRVVRFSKLPGMPELRKLVDTWQEDRMYDVRVKNVQLAIKARKLLAQNVVPVGILKVMYNNLFLCRLRHISSMTSCCSTNILGSLNPGLKLPSWFKCARVLARLVLIFIMVLPWVARLFVYYYYEQPLAETKAKAAELAGKKMPFSGSFTIYLTPLHLFFVVCYIILCLDSIIYGVLSEAVKGKMKLVLRRCLRDMRERSKVSVCRWVTSIVVLPCTFCGVFGLLLLPIFLVLLLPLLIPVLAFYLFPAVNLSVRLILHVVIFMCPVRVSRATRRLWHRAFYPVNRHVRLDTLTSEESFENRSSFKTWELPFQVLVVLMCLVSFWSITFLLMELLSFLVEMAVYTFIGVIVTADVTSQYLSVIFFLLLYGNGCFSAVHNKYLKYHHILHKELLTMMRTEIDNIARTAEIDQENTALRVQGDMAAPSTQPPATLKVLEGRPRWSLSSVLLFLDRKDTPFTPERFFEDTINLNVCGCPGELYTNILAALWNFLKIIIFLLFVFVVVMAFGSAYSVSSTNQLLATVAGGFIPFVFTHFFSKAGQANELDVDSVQFKTHFHTAINTYQQNWPVFDIEPEDTRGNNTVREEEEELRATQPDLPPLSSSTPRSTLVSSTAPSSDVSDKAESIDWDDTTVDIIFDMSKDPKATRELSRMGQIEAGSQTMLQKDKNSSDHGQETGAAGKNSRLSESSQQDTKGLLHV